MFKRHEEQIKTTDITDARLTDLNNALKMIERFWAVQTNFGALTPADFD